MFGLTVENVGLTAISVGLLFLFIWLFGWVALPIYLVVGLVSWATLDYVTGEWGAATLGKLLLLVLWSPTMLILFVVIRLCKR